MFQALLDRVKMLPDGDYAECGVYKGDSAEIILASLPDNAILYLLDTFAGHPVHSEYDSAAHPLGRYSDVDFAKVEERFEHDGRVVILKGAFLDTLPRLSEKTFRFVNCDCDLYESHLDVIDFFLPRMVKGGIIRFDDYTSTDCPGAKKAIEELIGSRLEHNYYTAS